MGEIGGTSGGGADGGSTEDVSIPGIVRNFGDPISGADEGISKPEGIPAVGAMSSGAPKDYSRAASIEKGQVITARGTAEGLVLRIESSVSRDSLRKSLREFMESRRNFIAGNDLIIEWSEETPEDPFFQELQVELAREFQVRFKDARIEAKPRTEQSGQGRPDSLGRRTPSLFDGIEALGIAPGADKTKVERTKSPQRAAPPEVWDDADARIIRGTLRSGQKVETEHSILVMGDVNSGAEIVAGGDVIVLGCLRGIAHAGAYDETGGGRTIFALNLQPTQLRIGSVISRGGASEGYAGPEVARVDGALIVVEAYQSRAAQGRQPGNARR